MPPDATTHTIRPDVLPPADGDTELALPLAVPGRRLVVGALLGSGGMGEVHEAEQQSLGRAVAVKSLAPHARTRLARRRLLQEAWATGALEHPNIVPVHDIVLDEGPDPQIVMKRVEGQEWASVLDHPEACFPTDDPVEWNLRVLLSVCHAMAFAHSRGILHRDLKPENVMVGAYGEVYVLDWGLAVRLGDDPGDGRIPLAREQRHVAGTPAYMAPEMAAGRGDLFDERTDVYLLGGLLHRVITGRPPRQGDSIGTLLNSAVHEPIPVDPSWPLAALLTSALALHPDERPPTVAAFQQAIEDHLTQRDARRLLVAGRGRLALLRASIQGNADRITIHEHGTAARFAFQEALSRWPGAPDADAGIDEVGVALARYELDHDHVETARMQIAMLARVPDDLALAIRAREDSRTAAAAQLRAYQADDDRATALVPRLVVTGALGAVWIGSPVLPSLVGVPPGYPRELAVSGTIVALTLALLAGLWPWFVRSRVNRELRTLLIATPTFACVLLGTCWLAGIPAELAAGLEGFVYFATVSLAAALIDLRLVPSALAHLVAFVVGTMRPELVLTLLGAANLVFGANMALIAVPDVLHAWRRRVRA